MSDSFSFRWGVPILDAARNSTVIYNFLLDHYAELKISNVEMMFVIHLARFHFESENGQSRPSVATIAAYMGVDERSVKRYRKSLEDAGWLRIQYRAGQTSIYDVAPLAQKCLELWQASRGDISVIPPVTKMSPEEEKKEKEITTPDGVALTGVGLNGDTPPFEEDRQANQRLLVAELSNLAQVGSASWMYKWAGKALNKRVPDFEKYGYPNAERTAAYQVWKRFKWHYDNRGGFLSGDESVWYAIVNDEDFTKWIIANKYTPPA